MGRHDVEDESGAFRLVAEVDELDAIENQMAPLRRSVRLIFGAAVASYLGILLGPELGEDFGYALLAAAIFVLLAGVMSLPWLRKLRQLKRSHEALLLSRGSAGDTEAP